MHDLRDGLSLPVDPTPRGPRPLTENHVPHGGDPKGQNPRLVNVALGKPASQSTSSAWSTPHGAAGAVNGKFDQVYGFHTGLDLRPWWCVDLLWQYPIDRVVIHNRLDQCTERARKIKVELSSDKETWVLIHAGLVHFSSGKCGDPLTLPLAGALTGRYVRLSLDDEQYFHLSQVEVLVKEQDAYKAEYAPGYKAEYATGTLAYECSSQPAKPIRTAILGTSNSIISNGYVGALSSKFVNLVANISLGSSHATMVPYRLTKLRADCDVMILDISVNEQKALAAKMYNMDLSVEVLEYFIGWCADHEVVPVVLIMPTHHGLADSGVSHIAMHYRHLCTRCAIPFFDGFALVNRLARAWQRTPISLCKLDKYHLSRFAAQVLGAKLSEQLTRTFGQFDVERLDADYHEFEYVPLETPPPGVEYIERGTSIATERFLRLVPGISIRLSLPESSAVVGMVFNMSQTNAALRLAGDRTITKRLDSPYFNPSRPLWLATWSLVSPVGTSREGLEIACVPIDLDESLESNDLTAGGTIAYAEHGPMVEIAGLIVRLPKRKGPSMRIRGITIDLVAALDLAGIAPLEGLRAR
jgi:hypothetical protein